MKSESLEAARSAALYDARHPPMSSTPEICYSGAVSAWLSVLLAATAQSAVPLAPSPSIKPERICRESERKTGSHIRTSRRCLTEEQWRVEDERRDRVPAGLRVTDGQDDVGQKRPQ